VSSKFGLDDHEEAPPVADNLSAALSTFGAVRPRAPIDLPAVDEAAERHGFVSREATITTSASVGRGRRRRAVPAEPVRHLAIRLPVSQYDRFVAFADSFKATYPEALKKLLDGAEAEAGN
jgi:hypothetical protein